MSVVMGMLEKDDSPETPEQLESVEIPEGVPPETRGSKQFALFAFIGIFLAIVGSAVLYLAARRTVVPAAAAAVPAPVMQTAKKADTPPPVQTSAPPPSTPLVPPAPAIVVPPAPVTVKQLSQPLPNRMYLQVGSLEKNVAEVMTQGLRIKGLPATVAPGVTSVVNRIIVGPFDDGATMAAAEKNLREMGFQPFPRRFEPAELREIFAGASTPQPPVEPPAQPPL